jgi:hypothetical protein
MVFHYLDDLDSKLAAVRVALASPSGDDDAATRHPTALLGFNVDCWQILWPTRRQADPSPWKERGDSG